MIDKIKLLNIIGSIGREQIIKSRDAKIDPPAVYLAVLYFRKDIRYQNSKRYRGVAFY